MRIVFLRILALLTIDSSVCFSQDDDNSTKIKNLKGFHIGIFTGTYFANKYTANLYDGHGYTLDGKQNDFYNSFIYRKINIEYGGGSGFTDRIAQALNVNPGDWIFSENDMPLKMRYNVALSVGAHMRYCFNNKEAIVLNVNGMKLNAAGNFTISFTSPYISSQPPGTQNYKVFAITGAEQRLSFQIGYQAIGGEEDEPLNFFIEGGPVITMAKFDKNIISINSLTIPLTTYYDPLGYVIYKARVLTGVGIGAFAGLGVNLNMSSKWTVQLLYSPSYEKINLGDDRKFKFQHTGGLRAYYNI